MTDAAGAGTPYRGIEPLVRVLVTTANDVQGYRVVKYHGVVRGIVVRATSIGQGIVGAFKSLGGGNIAEYVEVCEAARHEAYAQMVLHAEVLTANCIIAMRYDATEFAQGVTEVLAYGTAVTIAPE
jgi:uncharacterized protein YbjQ (UPF0145 family)